MRLQEAFSMAPSTSQVLDVYYFLSSERDRFQGGGTGVKLCMSAADYLSDCHPKLNMGEICDMYLCIDCPSSLPGKRVDDICKASLRWLHCL